MSIVMMSDIVEANGKTIKENNLSMLHTIALGSLVEISCKDYVDEENPKNGLRLFVVNHSRDCDGTPLYDLSAKRDIQKDLDYIEQERKQAEGQELSLLNARYWMATGAILRHYDVDSLKVV